MLAKYKIHIKHLDNQINLEDLVHLTKLCLLAGQIFKDKNTCADVSLNNIQQSISLLPPTPLSHAHNVFMLYY